MPSAGPPDEFFLSEFGTGELSSRLWRGGLRATPEKYDVERGVIDLKNALCDALDARATEQTIMDIVNELEISWNDTQRLKRACMPLTVQSSMLSTSLIKLLLTVDMFQTPIITCVINKISELSSDSSSDDQLSVLLLNQLRWLHFINDGKTLCQSLLSIVPVLSAPMQRRLIESLPEIIDDKSRDVAVSELLSIMQDSPSMIGSIVDALSALGVDKDRLSEINMTIISTLPAASKDVLPVCIKYLTNSCPEELVVETTREIRNTLALPSLGANHGRLCLDALKTGLRMSKCITEHMLKTFKKRTDASQCKAADFWILIALFDSPLHRRAAESLFRKKAACNFFPSHLLEAAIAPFADAFHAVTDLLLEMAALLMKASEVEARQTAIRLYALLFRLFDKGSTRKHVVTRLLNHTGTRIGIQMDSALEALVLIAKTAENDRSLMPYSASIQSLLDFLEVFTDAQLRQIWTILAYLCRATSGTNASQEENNKKRERRRSAESIQDLDIDVIESESELEMLQILLRKELTHSDMFYRRIGVIGACTMLKTLGNKTKNGIMAMLMEIGRGHPYTQAIVFDELAEVFGTDNDEEGDSLKDTAESMRRAISNHFEKKYIGDKDAMGSLIKTDGLLPATLYGNLEGSEYDFSVLIAKQIRYAGTLKRRQDTVRVMIPTLRLLCVLTSNRYDGSLTEIDAVIGAPLHMPVLPSGQDTEELSTLARSDLLLSLFIAHGWTIELINAFAEQDGSEIRAKCIKRLENLLELNSQISDVAAMLPTWGDVLFDSYNGTRRNASGTGGVGGDGNSSKRGRKKNPENAKRPSSASSSEWKRYARHLAPSALSLIRVTSPVSWRLTETQSSVPREGEPSVETVSLSSSSLQFLLSELFRTISSLVGSSLQNENALGVSYFRFMSSGKFEGGCSSNTNEIIREFQRLRTPLTVLGQQLSLCLDKIFPGDEDLEIDDEVSLETHRQCMFLTLKCLARCLNSAVIIGEERGQRLIFDILASIKLSDDAESPTVSDPFDMGDVECSAKFAFSQLAARLEKILVDADDMPVVNGDRTAKTLSFEGCCAYLSVMDACYQHCNEGMREDLGEKLSGLSFKVLEQSWDIGTLRSRRVQKMIPALLRVCIQYSESPLDSAEDARNRVVAVCQRLDDRNKSKTLDGEARNSQICDDRIASLTEQTACAFAVGVLEQYIWLFKRYKGDKFEDTEESMMYMERLLKALLPLYNLARGNDAILCATMRGGRVLVDCFVRNLLPHLKSHFETHRGRVVQLCKMHQKPTRVLQTFCAHSKSIRDLRLTGLVPGLRKSLESVVYKVKEMVKNGGNGTFELGNLKHRDINGGVVGSQQWAAEEEEDSEYGTDEEQEEEQKEDGGGGGGGDGGGDDGEMQEASDEVEEMVDVAAAGARRGRKRGSNGGGGDVVTKRRKGSADAVSKSSAVGRKRRGSLAETDSQVRHALIDDEAGEAGEEEEEEGEGEDGGDGGDLSQFLVFGDEEEEEEEEEEE